MIALPLVTVDARDTEAFAAWSAALRRTIIQPSPTPQQLAQRAASRVARDSRLWAVMDGRDTVATFESYESTAGAVADPAPGRPPGQPGRLVDVEAITAVTVASTHRRRGLLSRWLTQALSDARDRGAPLATLIASEGAIYGRFGFAPVVDSMTMTIDTRAARAGDPLACPAGGHRIRLVESAEWRSWAPALYEVARSAQPAAVPREPTTWEHLAEPDPGDIRTQLVLAHTSDASDGVDGFARLAVSGDWDHRSPVGTAEVTDLTVVDPAVAGCLWRACLALDLVTTVVAHDRPLTDPLPELLVDRRAARQTARADLYWWRILDLPAALRSRWWAGPAQTLVVEVHDRLGYAAGRWSIDIDESGTAEAVRTEGSPDLTLDVSGLATLLAGQGSLLRLAVAGRVDEHAPGAVAALDRAAWAPAAAHVTYTWF